MNKALCPFTFGIEPFNAESSPSLSNGGKTRPPPETPVVRTKAACIGAKRLRKAVVKQALCQIVDIS